MRPSSLPGLPAGRQVRWLRREDQLFPAGSQKMPMGRTGTDCCWPAAPTIPPLQEGRWRTNKWLKSLRSILESVALHAQHFVQSHPTKWCVITRVKTVKIARATLNGQVSKSSQIIKYYISSCCLAVTGCRITLFQWKTSIFFTFNARVQRQVTR